MLISQLTVGQPGWWGWGQEEHCCPKSSPGPSGPSWQDEGKVRGKLEAGHISPGHSQPQASKECTESQATREGARPVQPQVPSGPATLLLHSPAVQLTPRPLQRLSSRGGAPPASLLPGNTPATPLNRVAPTPSQQPLEVLWGKP